MAGKRLEYLDRGSTSTIYQLSGTQKVCKSFNEDCIENHFLIEKEVYERFNEVEQHHPTSILRYHGVHETEPAGLVLDLAGNGNVYEYLWDHHQGPPYMPNLLRWARQAAEGLAFAHSYGVMHCDIHCVNFVLDQRLDLQVVDWAGASMGGKKSWSFYRSTHRLQDRSELYTPHMEIFALGSAIHFMVVGRDVFPGLTQEHDSDEIAELIKAKQFPDTSSFPVLGDVISKCWNVEYDTMSEVVEAIMAEETSYTGTFNAGSRTLE